MRIFPNSSQIRRDNEPRWAGSQYLEGIAGENRLRRWRDLNSPLGTSVRLGHADSPVSERVGKSPRLGSLRLGPIRPFPNSSHVPHERARDGPPRRLATAPIPTTRPRLRGQPERLARRAAARTPTSISIGCHRGAQVNADSRQPWPLQYRDQSCTIHRVGRRDFQSRPTPAPPPEEWGRRMGHSSGRAQAHRRPNPACRERGSYPARRGCGPELPTVLVGHRQNGVAYAVGGLLARPGAL